MSSAESVGSRPAATRSLWTSDSLLHRRVPARGGRTKITVPLACLWVINHGQHRYLAVPHGQHADQVRAYARRGRRQGAGRPARWNEAARAGALTRTRVLGAQGAGPTCSRRCHLFTAAVPGCDARHILGTPHAAECRQNLRSTCGQRALKRSLGHLADPAKWPLTC
jgi:hypothetical protein